MAKEVDPVLAAFGAALRGARRELGLSQEQLADRAGLDRAYVGGVERGERNVALLNIVRLAAAAGSAPDQLLRRPEFLAASRLPNGHRMRTRELGNPGNARNASGKASAV